LYTRAACVHREADVVHERAHDENAQTAHAQLIRIETLSLADGVKTAALVGDLHRELAVLVRTDDGEMAAEHVAVLRGVVARLAGGEGDVADVAGGQTAAASEGRDLTPRFGNRGELAGVPALQRLHDGIIALDSIPVYAKPKHHVRPFSLQQSHMRPG